MPVDVVGLPSTGELRTPGNTPVDRSRAGSDGARLESFSEDAEELEDPARPMFRLRNDMELKSVTLITGGGDEYIRIIWNEANVPSWLKADTRYKGRIPS